MPLELATSHEKVSSQNYTCTSKMNQNDTMSKAKHCAFKQHHNSFPEEKKPAAVLITTGKAIGIMYTTCITWKMFLGPWYSSFLQPVEKVPVKLGFASQMAIFSAEMGAIKKIDICCVQSYRNHFWQIGIITIGIAILNQISELSFCFRPVCKREFAPFQIKIAAKYDSAIVANCRSCQQDVQHSEPAVR